MSKVTTKIGKGNTLFYALVVSAILAWQSIKVEYKKPEGWTFQSQPIPVAVLTPCLVVLGVALGINVREELLILAALISKNSKAIEELAEQQQLQQSESVTDTKSDDTEKLQ